MSSAGLRGHVIFWAYPDSETRQMGRCGCCGKTVYINTKPQPNDIEIGGEAVALNCTDQ
jgi:hypothetical protein